MSSKQIWALVVIAVVLAGALVLFGGDAEAPDQETAGEGGDGPAVSGLLAGDNALYAADQKPGEMVAVEQVVLKDGGYVVIHEEEEGAPGAILGASEYLPAGGSEDIEITLSRATADGETLYAMLHQDDGDEEFDPSADGPITENGDIVLMKFTIDAEAEDIGDVSL